eukprot:SAG31_NODE_3538_length_4145_cov_1.703658_3_plen_106_part_00
MATGKLGNSGSVWESIRDRVVFIAVNLDTPGPPPVRVIEPAWRKLHHVHAVLKQPAVGQFGVRFLPTTVVVDSRGRLAANRAAGFKGRLHAQDLFALLQHVLELT